MRRKTLPAPLPRNSSCRSGNAANVTFFSLVGKSTQVDNRERRPRNNGRPDHQRGAYYAAQKRFFGMCRTVAVERDICLRGHLLLEGISFRADARRESKFSAVPFPTKPFSRSAVVSDFSRTRQQNSKAGCFRRSRRKQKRVDKNRPFLVKVLRGSLTFLGCGACCSQLVKTTIRFCGSGWWRALFKWWVSCKILAQQGIASFSCLSVVCVCQRLSTWSWNRWSLIMLASCTKADQYHRAWPQCHVNCRPDTQVNLYSTLPSPYNNASAYSAASFLFARPMVFCWMHFHQQILHLWLTTRIPAMSLVLSKRITIHASLDVPGYLRLPCHITW